ncbi:MAG: ABC transporter ATP-binding protein [Burkholderiales bacterium]|nr:ABC transporter ATP-binding protein [Burkholderiales bacterium]
MRKVRVNISNVSMSYGQTPVLRDVSVNIEPGEFFALLGPSGSGKSTLLRLIAGFNQSQSGTIAIDDEDISRVPPWHRNIGMVFQNYALWPHMTVNENVAFGLVERRLPRVTITRKVAAALELVGLQEYGERRPNQLSGGQQQRVAVARTIAIEPKVLLLDEPLSNLDAKLRVHMRTELLALQRKLGITTIFVTHDQEEALSISDRVAVLDQGVIQQVGTPMELYDNPVNRFIANFVGTINLLPGEVRGGFFDSPDIGKFRLPAAIAVNDGKIEIAFRPHTLTLSSPDRSTGPIQLPGTVSEREFLGEFVRYRVKVGTAEIVADQPHLGGVPDFLPGHAVTVSIDPAQVRLFTA